MSNNSFSYNTYNEITPYYKRLSSSIKLSKHGKNLLNVDFTNPNDKLNSPRSQIALLNLGIDMNCLYYLSRDEYLSKHPELKNESIDVKNRYYYHFEEKRKNKIKRAIKKRDELISSSPSSPKNYSTDNINLIDPSAIKREQEQLDLMKKQNLCEIKNLIDFEININKRRSANEHKLLLQQEREYKRKESKEKERQEKVKEEKIFKVNLIDFLGLAFDLIVIVALPVFLIVITPFVLTVATLLLLEEYVTVANLAFCFLLAF
jgi:hypothetical protein